MLRLDEKYFIPFIAVVTLILTAAIFVYSFEYSDTQQEIFQNEVAQYTWSDVNYYSISDSTKVIPLGSKYHLLFMAEWSQRSLDAAKTLSDSIEDSNLVFALVKDSIQFVQKVWPEIPENRTTLGTDLYASLKTPGLPTLIVISEGKIDTAVVGYRNEDSYRFLNKTE